MKEKKRIAARIFAALLCMTTLFALVACSNSNPPSNTDNLSLADKSPPSNSVNDTANIEFEYSQPTGKKVAIVDVQQGQRYLLPDMYVDYANSDYLNSVLFNATVPATCKSTKLIDVGSGGAQLKIKGAEEGAMPEAKLCGVSDHAALADFISGERKLAQGRFFEAKNECIISEDLAKHASLSIGDTMTFDNITLGDNGKKITYKLTIVGIYSDKTQEYTSPYPIPYFNRRNEVITNFETIMNAENAISGAGVMMEAAYYLKDSALLSDFQKELRDKGMPNGFDVQES